VSIVRPILWAVAAMLFAAFAIANWTSVPLAFGATQVDIKLPVLLLAVALLVWLPASLRVRLARRRVSALTATAAAHPAYVPPVSHPAALDQAQPTIVPPGCG
jgi:uncharacterized integral membrane protein